MLRVWLPGQSHTLPTSLPASSMEEKKDEEQQQNGRSEALQKRAQWLRAAILGANDGLLSTTSLMLGVGAARDDRQSMVLSGLAGALAGALSMAVGEFVSVSTQRDIERVNNNDFLIPFSFLLISFLFLLNIAFIL